jgi:hypothetical protein
VQVKPKILLDVDGVLNAMPPRGAPLPDTWQDWSVSRAEGFQMHTSRAMARSIAELGDVHWLTTWNEDNLANVVISPLVGIGPFPVAARPSDRLVFGDEMWKPRTAEVFSKQHERVVWIDDDALHLWAEWKGGAAFPSNMLVVGPNPDTGLTPDEIEQIKGWIANESTL